MGDNGAIQNPGNEEWKWTEPQQDPRLQNLLMSGDKSDLTMYLGQERLKVRVHRVFLQTGSQVLNGMIRRNTKQITIRNVDSRIFKILLQYFYTGKSNVVMDDALEVMQLAEEYEVSGLSNDCAAILKANVSLNNALSLFQSGMEYGHRDLIESTLNFICENANRLLKCEDFAKLRLECLVEIIQRDSLKVLNEMKVFEAVHWWGVAECTRKNMDPTNVENLRTCLAKPLSHIRFSLMDPTEFTVNVTSTKLLNMDQVTELETYFCNRQWSRNLLPPGRFVSSTRNFICWKTTVTRAIVGDERCVGHVDAHGNANGTETLMIRANKNVLLRSISVPKELLKVNGPMSEYFYKLVQAEVTICNGPSDSECKPDNEILTTFDQLKICLTPPYKIYKQDGWTKLMVTLCGHVSFQDVVVRGDKDVYSKVSFNLNQKVFPQNMSNRVVTNYGEFTTLGKLLDVEVERPAGMRLDLSHGFIEMLEVETF